MYYASVSFRSTSVVRLIDNYLVVVTRGFLGAGLFAIQRPSSPAIAYPEARQRREAVIELGEKVVMERSLHSAFLRLSQPPAANSRVLPVGATRTSLSSVAPVFVPTSVLPSVGATSNVAMDAAVAAREASQVIFFNANFRLFKFIFLIQEGYSRKERIERFNSNLGVDSRSCSPPVIGF